MAGRRPRPGSRPPQWAVNRIQCLASRNCLRVLMLLGDGGCTAGEVASSLELRLTEVSKLLAKLRHTGLAAGRHAAQSRYYGLTEEGRRTLEAIRPLSEVGRGIPRGPET